METEMESNTAIPVDQGSDLGSNGALDLPPPYQLHSTSELLDSSATVLENGTINITFSSKNAARLSRLVRSTSIREAGLTEPRRAAGEARSQCPPMNLVIHVVGSRGDVQPFIAYGTALQRRGHRVRLATHDAFGDFVRKSGLEFFPVGGDPADLMSYMVRNPGLLPSIESLRGGDIGRKRRMMREMLVGFYNSCILPDPVTKAPFVADAIIGNPPSFAHIHCAQALGIPVHLAFTMPWTPTGAFSHPLAHIRSREMESGIANYLSYGMVELLTWQGLGGVINSWRTRTLKLEPVAASMGPSLATYLRIPHTYCWSPSMVPKPVEWGDEIDVCGFFMRDFDELSYSAPADLVNFLQAGPPPVYFGFGSIVVDDPERLTNVILEATRECGVRAIISKGWSKLGGENPQNTTQALFIGDCAHEWLFKRVSVVVHHGGAGTTACGLVNARPTIIVPFFGDQPFWGQVVASVGAGSSPIPQQIFNTERLVAALQYCLSPEASVAAHKIAGQMQAERGVDAAVESFHSHLPVAEMTCDFLPGHAARWRCKVKGKHIKLSNLAAAALIQEKKINKGNIELLRVREYNTDVSRWDPVTGGASSLLGIVTDFTTSLGGTFIDPFKNFKRYREAVRDDGSHGSVASASGVAALSAGKGIAGMAGTLVRGMTVDMTLAFAEGMRNSPRLYGAEPDNYGTVKDWKSGAVVGGKAFGLGFYNGLTGLVTEPYKGAKDGGALGFCKGAGRGGLGLVSKPGTAMFGLYAYPAQGVYKSIVSGTDRKIKVERFKMIDNALPFLDDATRKETVERYDETISKKKA
ncbi:hypothetical protein N7536_010936 [Penicillium majusculum]|nr:hypothetical protein N7536_010936 [Penicillium majusculum]